MIGHLLFVAATFVGGEAAQTPPAPKPVVIEMMAAVPATLPPASLDGIAIAPNPPVTIEVENGRLMTTGRAELERMATLAPETDDEYHTRIFGQACQIRPETCPQGTS